MNMELSKWQADFMNRFDDDLTIACCGISSGKSRVLAIWLVLQALKNPGIRGVLIAQNYKALSRVLVREIQVVCASMNVEYAFSKSAMEFKFPNESVLFCYSAENPTGILGLSEIALLACDEAAYLSEEIYHNARDRMRGSKYPSKVRLISSPQNSRMSNYFSNLVKKYPNKVIRATAFDNPFTSQAFKDELKERYCEGTPIYRQQVLGELLDGDVIDQIVNRVDFAIEKTSTDSDCYMGIDFAGLGADSNVIIVIDKYGVRERLELNQANSFEIVDIVKKMYQKYHIVNASGDGTGGYGNGTFDILDKQGLNIERINFASKSDDEQYNNIRTNMYMLTAKAIKNGFWVDDTIKEELIAQSHYIDNHGKIALVPKADVKKNLGHSPDSSDSLALAILAMNHNKTKVNDEHYKNVADKYLDYFNAYN